MNLIFNSKYQISLSSVILAKGVVTLNNVHHLKKAVQICLNEKRICALLYKMFLNNIYFEESP